MGLTFENMILPQNPPSHQKHNFVLNLKKILKNKVEKQKQVAKCTNFANSMHSRMSCMQTSS
jgi:hypothetical protein